MTELVDLLMKGGPWTIIAMLIVANVVQYRDRQALDAKFFDIFERGVRRLQSGDDKEGT